MDGRVQIPVIEYMLDNYHTDYVDVITEAGPNLILAENYDNLLSESIRRRIEISVEKHKSGLVAVVGHYDCAGNPSAKEEQLVQLRKAINNLAVSFPSTEFLALWVDENWQVHKIDFTDE